MMHISPSSNFQNLHENVDDKDEDYEEDDYEEDDEEEVEKIENKSESIISSTSRSTTTVAPDTEATTTSTTTSTTTTSRTTTSTATTSNEEDQPVPFFPTRMTTADTAEKSSTMPVLPTKTAATTTTTEEIEKSSTPETAKQEIEEKDKGTSLKDLLRSGKYGNDPVKIKELLKNMKPEAGAADKPNDQDEVDPKDIFKKYANLAKSKTATVEVNISVEQRS
jgi:hypothetical protein